MKTTQSRSMTRRPLRVGASVCALVLAAAATVAGAVGVGAKEKGPGTPLGLDLILPFTPTVDTLPNGLTVTTVKTGARGIIAYYTVVRTGSRDEVEKGRSGYAHFFEHMMFRGTEKYSPEKYGEVLQRHGADGNAYTSLDVTAYHVVAPKAALADIVAIESDRFMSLKYEAAAFKTEAGAVLGEYNKSFSRPGMRMWEALSETAFTKHTYGHTTIGYEKDVKAMPEGFAYSRKFFRSHYTPDNCTILVVGDITRDELLPVVEKAYGGWKGKRAGGKVPAEPPQKRARSAHIDWPSETPPMLYVGWKIPGFSVKTRDRAAIDVLGELLFGRTSELYKRLVLDEARVLVLDSSSGWHMRDPHLFIVDAKYKDAADTDDILAALQKALDAAASGKLDAKRVEEIKSHVTYSTLMRLETVTQVAELLTDSIVLTGDPLTAEAHLQRMSEVTVDDVARVAREYMTEARRTAITLAHAPASEAKDGAKDVKGKGKKPKKPKKDKKDKKPRKAKGAAS